MNQQGTTLLSLGNGKIFDMCKKPLDCGFLVGVTKEPGFQVNNQYVNFSLPCLKEPFLSVNILPHDSAEKQHFRDTYSAHCMHKTAAVLDKLNTNGDLITNFKY